MSSKATKIQAGLYEYRGYEIERTESGEWTTRKMGDSFPSDTLPTLRDAKALVNHYENQHETIWGR